MNRPGLQALITDIKEVEAVLVYKLDRLSRSQKDALFLIEDVFLKNGVNFVSISENFDTSTAFGRAMIGILAVFAQLERETIKERMSLGKSARAKLGEWNGGLKSPIGYEYIPGVGLVINEYEAITVRRIFDMYTSGVAVQEIYAILKREKVASRYGYYTWQAVRRIIRNPVYAGYLSAKNGEIYRGKHKPIISQEVYETAQNLLKNRHDEWENNVRSAKSQAMLSGIIFCAQCGGRYHKYKYGKAYPEMYSCYSRSKKNRQYIVDPNCKNRNWGIDELDNLILRECKKLTVNRDVLKGMVDKKPGEKNLSVLEKQLSKLQKQRSKLMDLYALDEITIESVREKLKPINDQISALEAEIKKPRREKQIEIPENAMELIDRGTPAQKRAIVLSLIRRIELDGEDVKIYWKFK